MPALPYRKLKDTLPIPSAGKLREALDHIEGGNCAIIDCQFGEEVVSALRLCVKAGLANGQEA